MTALRLAAIVEGHGEMEAVPILVRRVALELDPGLVPRVDPVLRVPASRLLKAGELERTVEFAARKLQGQGGILVLVDCDWDGGCPAHEGPELLSRARSARPDLPIAVVLAKKEYEAWFLAAAESLRGRRRLSEDLMPPPRPEEIRGAKGWLSRHMPKGRSYAETTDQPTLTELFDFNAARRADSFDKFYREMIRLLTMLQST